MLDIKTFRESPDRIREALAKRNTTEVDVDRILEMDETRRRQVYEVEQLRAEQNKASAEIAQKKKAKDAEKK